MRSFVSLSGLTVLLALVGLTLAQERAKPKRGPAPGAKAQEGAKAKPGGDKAAPKKDAPGKKADEKAGSQTAKDASKETAATEREASADEKAIRATADSFVKAFEAGDAQAVAAHFAPNAE